MIVNLIALAINNSSIILKACIFNADLALHICCKEFAFNHSWHSFGQYSGLCMELLDSLR